MSGSVSSHSRRSALSQVALSATSLALLLLPLTSCAPDDAAVQASLAAQPPPPSVPPRDDVATTGTEKWRVPLGIPEALSYAVGHTDSTFLLTVLDDAGMDATIGDIGTGATAGRFALPKGSGWPVITGDARDPIITAAVPAADGDGVTVVTAWNTMGTARWLRSAADLGTTSGTGLRVDVAEAGRVVVRTADGAASPFQDTELWVLDAANGATVWGTPGGATVRWAEAAHGLLMYTWRSDAAPDQPSDRVSIRAVDDGREVGTAAVVSDYGGGTRLNTQCGGIASAQRIVMCDWQGDNRVAILAQTDGSPIREWPITELPLIDAEAGVVVLWVPGEDGGLLGVDAATGEQLWRYPPDDLLAYEIVLDAAANGVLLGSAGAANVAVSARTGVWLVRERFDYLRPGSAIGDHVVEFRGGDAVGSTGPGVGVATLQDEGDSVLFVRP